MRRERGCDAYFGRTNSADLNRGFQDEGADATFVGSLCFRHVHPWKIRRELLALDRQPRVDVTTWNWHRRSRVVDRTFSSRRGLGRDAFAEQKVEGRLTVA